MSGRIPVLQTITLGATYAPLAATSLVGDFTITALGTNAGSAYFEGDDASDVIVTPNSWYEFRGVDLSLLRMKGTIGDKVTIIGNA